MDFSALGGCHQPLHPVPRRSSGSSEPSPKVRFSGFFIVPAGARLFCLGMMALILTLPWNPPSAYARSFSNDGIPASPTVMDLDAASASPPALPSEVPPTPSHVLISPPLPSGSAPPISMANPPSPSTGAPAQTPIAKKRKSLNWRITVGIVVSAFVVGICLPGTLLCWWILFRHPLRIFISYGGASCGSGKNFAIFLYENMKSKLKRGVKIFFDQKSMEYGEISTNRIFAELAKFDIGIVVVTKEYFERKWAMTELIAFVEAEKNDPRNRICILPLFYGLTPKELKDHLLYKTWEGHWEEMATCNHPIEVEKCREAVTWLCHQRGILYNSHKRNYDKEYICTICQEIDMILIEQRIFASSPWRAMTTKRVTQMPLIGIEKRKKRANQRAGKENGLMTYINKRVQLLFALSGLLNILLSVILDNFFNHLPIRFIAFGILAPLTIILGFLASGWFPRIPLRFIAFVKQRGFLKHVVPCSPWHDNVVTNYCGEVCSLKPLEQEEGTRLLDFPISVQKFLYGDQTCPRGTNATAIIHSTFDLETQDFQVATSVQEGQDLQGLTTSHEMIDFAPVSGILEHSYSEIVGRQASSSNLHKAPSEVGDIVVEIDRSSVFHILDDERAPILEFDGPEINGFPLKVQAFKNTLTKDDTFYLSCTFRNKRTKRMYLIIGRLQNLVRNMRQWVLSPHPIVVDESSDVLHCMAIEDILWEFTKAVHTFRSIHVEHRFLAGLKKFKFIITSSYVVVTFMLSVIPLFSDKKSYFFLFFLFVIVPYLFDLKKTNPLNFYIIKSFLCPLYIRIFGFNRLYKSRSSFRWCNEFRKKRIVNPKQFWIDEEYANTFLDRASCFDVCEFLELPDSPPKDQSFTISCQGWRVGIPAILKKQHEYELQVKFVARKVIDDFECYSNVTLTFLDGLYLLGEKNYGSVEVRRVHLVEKLFHCFSDPSFGGYIEEICPRGYCSTTFVAHCPRFIDICHEICSSKSIPKLLVASRLPGSKFVVGVPF